MPPKKNYTPEQMAQAVAAVLSQGVSKKSAAKSFGVPRITLHNKISGKSPLVCNMGPSSILSPSEEELLVKWVIAMGERKFPISKDQLLDSVQRIITEQNRPTPFSGNRSGKKWYSSFLKRQPILAERTAENVSSARVAVTEEQISNWFKEVENYLKENDLSGILQDPNKIFNTDESAFCLAPKPGRVLMKRGANNVYMANGDDKDHITVLVTANAAGKLAPPMIVYDYDRIPADVAQKVPVTWAIGKSASGWMCSDTFFEYVANVFNPWLIEEDIQKPVLLFVDGHKSHLTLHLSNFCLENGIQIIALYPNSTHILQPMDIAVFRPLKVFFRKAVVQWRMENNGMKLKKADFAPVFKNALDKITEHCIKNGFRGGGLYPFGPDYIDLSKLRRQNISSENSDRAQQQFLNHLESQIIKTFGQDKLAMYNRLFFKGRNVLENIALDEDMNLYIIWAHNKQKAIIPVVSTASDQTAGTSTSRLESRRIITASNTQPEPTASPAASNDAGLSSARPEPMASPAASNNASLFSARPELLASPVTLNDASLFKVRPEPMASPAALNDASLSSARLELMASSAASNDAGLSSVRPESMTFPTASNDAGLSSARPELMASPTASNNASRPELMASPAASKDASLSSARLELMASSAASNDAGLSSVRPEPMTFPTASNDAGLSSARPELMASPTASNNASRPELMASPAASKDASLSSARPELMASSAASNDASLSSVRPEPMASPSASNDATLFSARPELMASPASSNNASLFSARSEPMASPAASNDGGSSSARPESMASLAASNDAGLSSARLESTASTAASNDAGPSNSRYEATAYSATPEKRGIDAAIGYVSSPFKKCLFWPEEIKKTTRKKDKVPSAVTSQAWQKYHQKKQEEKIRVLQEKELRAKQRLEKKLQKQEIEKRKKKKKGNVKKRKVDGSSSSEDSETEIPYEESDESEYDVRMEGENIDEDEEMFQNKLDKVLQIKRKRTEENDSDTPLANLRAKAKGRSSKNSLKKGCYVIVTYEGEYFPGIIKNADKQRFEISTMTLSTGNTFRWPERPDTIWYPAADVVEIINPPIQHNNRGFYKVKEMAKYLPDIY